jgi:beta-mannosidase
MHMYLDRDWTLEPLSGPVPRDVAAAGPIAASVPGSVHTDLLASGLVPDPYLDNHERRLTWIGSADWRYATLFDWTPDGHDRTDLVFEGLDTVADVALNGRVLHRSRNMHQHVNHHPCNAIRKMRCNFGWDWRPDLVTAGIWRRVSLQSWNTGRLASARPIVDVTGEQGTVEVHVDVKRAREAAPLTVTATIGDVQASGRIEAGQTAAVVRLIVAGVDRWWPRGVDPDAVVSDMLTTVLPGETVTWAVWSGSDADPDSLLAPTVLRSANQLLASR